MAGHINQRMVVDILFDELNVIVDHFREMLVNNGCKIAKLKTELDIVHDHIIKFALNHEPVKCWPLIFKLKHELGVRNILHIIELCLVTPLSNAES